jgi:hypothetical protein
VCPTVRERPHQAPATRMAAGRGVWPRSPAKNKASDSSHRRQRGTGAARDSGDQASADDPAARRELCGQETNAFKVRLHPHTFSAHVLLARGIPIEDVSVLLGQKSVSITEAYYAHGSRRGASG